MASYEIQSGDTLSEIAEKNNTSVAEIMAANPQIKDANKIQAGANLNISSVKDSGSSTYAGNVGTSSGGSSQDDAKKALGEEKYTAISSGAQTSATQNMTPEQITAAANASGLRIGPMNYDAALNMSESKYTFNTKDAVIGGILGAIVPGAGLLYGAGQYLNAAQDRKIGEQLLLQGDYEPTGLFGSSFLAGPAAVQYVPVYDENDEIVGSLGLDADGKAIRYTGDRDENYTGLGEEYISRVPMTAEEHQEYIRNMSRSIGRDDDDNRVSPVSAEAAGVPVDELKPVATPPGQAKIPMVQLPSALEQPKPEPVSAQRPTGTAVTQPNQIPADFGRRTAVPNQEGGIMATMTTEEQMMQYPFMFGLDSDYADVNDFLGKKKQLEELKATV